MGKLGLTEPHEQLVKKYGEENAALVAETLGNWTQNYTRYLYLKMGICPEDDYIEQTRKGAGDRGWQFELRDGKLTLLEKLFTGQWDDDFVIIPPAATIIARNDETVLDVRPLVAD